MKYHGIFTTTTFIKQARRRAEDEDMNLLQASRDVGKEVLRGYLLYYGISILLLLVLLATLSFTDLLGGPFLVAQILLFLVGGSIVIFSTAVWWLWRKIKEKLKDMPTVEFNGRSHKNEDVKEATIIDGHIEE